MMAVKTKGWLRIEELSEIDVLMTFDHEAQCAWESVSIDAPRE
jgi:hypothetical protein